MKKRNIRKHLNMFIMKIQKEDIRRAQKECWWRGFNHRRNIHYRIKQRFRAYHLIEPKAVTLCAAD